MMPLYPRMQRTFGRKTRIVTFHSRKCCWGRGDLRPGPPDGARRRRWLGGAMEELTILALSHPKHTPLITVEGSFTRIKTPMKPGFKQKTVWRRSCSFLSCTQRKDQPRRIPASYYKSKQDGRRGTNSALLRTIQLVVVFRVFPVALFSKICTTHGG